MTHLAGLFVSCGLAAMAFWIVYFYLGFKRLSK
jgi:hypothetical protein